MPNSALHDAIGMEIFANRLLAITEEMGVALVRSSFSPNIKERRDCSVALFTATGKVIAQAAHIPIHLGSLLGAVEGVLRDYPLETLKPGDAFVCNDAYLAGGTHLPDIAIVTPVFFEGTAKFFVANLGHHADVGGPTPGSINHAAANIFEEGLRIPPTRVRRDFEVDEGIVRLIAHNTREPEDRELDLIAQLATNDAGATKVVEMVSRLGLEAVERAVEDLLTYTARRLAEQIKTLPDGTYSHTVWMDHDGLGGERLAIVATAHVDGGHLTLDFEGTGPQSRGGFNVMPSGVKATVAYACKALLDPELPPNSGLFDAVALRIPKGSVLNPNFPAAVGARTTTCQKLAGAIFGALTRAMPSERAMADSHDVLAAMVFSGMRPKSKRPYVYLETIGGGNGARRDSDGMDGAHVHITNSLNMPIEAVELEFPLRVKEYALLPDSGGAGTYRGGLGIGREVEVLSTGTVFSARADSFLTCAQGLDGGLQGSHARVVLNRGTDREQVVEPKQSAVVLEAGDTVRVETPGGAGMGSPIRRDAKQVAADFEDGKISLDAARRDYGLESVS